MMVKYPFILSGLFIRTDLNAQVSNVWHLCSKMVDAINLRMEIFGFYTSGGVGPIAHDCVIRH